mmetsp:Transcript_8808/g.22194  ORF Transcript_8808/g.22194 Transcript_8808/m.22194 type:complete len:299 (-) Transcript_8808:327-1223(-)
MLFHRTLLGLRFDKHFGHPHRNICTVAADKHLLEKRPERAASVLQRGGGGLHWVVRRGRDSNRRKHKAQTFRELAVPPELPLPAQLLRDCHLAHQLQPLNQHVLVLLLRVPLRAIHSSRPDLRPDATGCHYNHINGVGLLQEGIVLVQAAPQHQDPTAEEHVGLVCIHGRAPALAALRAQPRFRLLDMSKHVRAYKESLLRDVAAQRGQSPIIPELATLQDDHSPRRRVGLVVQLRRHVQGVVHDSQKLCGVSPPIPGGLGHIGLAVPLELVPHQVLAVVPQSHRHPAPIGLLVGVLA